jgi:hypothetical protein
MMLVQNEILKDEVAKLDYFVESSQKLFDSKFVDFLNNIKNNARIKKVEKKSNWKISQLHVNQLKK